MLRLDLHGRNVLQVLFFEVVLVVLVVWLICLLAVNALLLPYLILIRRPKLLLLASILAHILVLSLQFDVVATLWQNDGCE